MDYGQPVCNGEVCDMNYLKHVGWSEGNFCIKKYFSPETVKIISRKVTELTMGVDEKNRPIVVPDIRICEVMNSVFWNFRPTTGDIYSRYIVPNNQEANMVQSMIDQTINIIVGNIRNQLGMEQANKKLSAWVQVLGDFNNHNLRSHPPLRIKERRPAPMQFFANY